MHSLQGQLLVATPELVDPNFRKTVVLIVRHTADEGALGLVLNRQTGTSVKELSARMGHEECQSEEHLSLGGPCEGPLMALHKDQPLGEFEVFPGLFFSAGGESLQQLMSRTSPDTRFFFGYAGWGAGQLESELESGAWVTEPAALKHVFAMNQGLWERSSSEAAGWEVLSVLKIKDVSGDPSLN